MAERERALGGLSFLAAGIAAILFGAVYLIAVAGRVSGDDALHLLAIDRFCPDITLLAVVLVETLLGFLGLLFVGDTGFPLVDMRQYFICGMMMCAMAVLAIGWMLTASRQCKAGMLWSNTMISRVLRLLKRGWGYLRRCFAMRSLPVRYWGIAIPVILCCIALSFAFPLSLVLAPVIFLAVFGMHGKFFSAMERIKEGAARIRGGELDFRIDSTDAAGLEDLIGDINNVAEGLSAAVEGEVKAERLKTELITNVSHDIKTPLTSIITYVDLLQKQDLPGPARDYVDVLARKSQRLKALTEDLFEAAKAASGTLPVHMERVDLCALIRQGMGELDDRIIQSGLTVRTNFCEESLVYGRRAAPLAHPGEHVFQRPQICHARLPGLSRHPGPGGLYSVGDEKRLSPGTGHSGGRVDGAVCAGGLLPSQRGVRTRTLYCPQFGPAHGRAFRNCH